MAHDKTEQGEKVVATNRKAFHDYAIQEKVEAGIALVGTEVKALREGRANLRDSFASVDRGQVVLHHCHISPYSHGDRKSTRLNSSHVKISYAVFCLKKKKNKKETRV